MKAFSLKSLVKSHPHLYDLILKERHRFAEETDPVHGFLARFSEARAGAVRFIAVGAGDGLTNDRLREFILRHDWRGVLVEPEPASFHSLMRNYPLRRFRHIRLVPTAVSANEDDGLLLFTVKPAALAERPPEERAALRALASLDHDRLVAGLAARGLGPEAIAALEVQPATVERLARAFFPDRHFDLLILDAGGHEAAILDGLDLERVHPDAILMPGDALGARREALTPKLVRAGYAVRPIGPALLASLV